MRGYFLQCAKSYLAVLFSSSKCSSIAYTFRFLMRKWPCQTRFISLQGHLKNAKAIFGVKRFCKKMKHFPRFVSSKVALNLKNAKRP